MKYNLIPDNPKHYNVRFADGTDERLAAPSAADALEEVRSRHPVSVTLAYESPSIADMQAMEAACV
jgi:hypothetical protein